MTVNVIAGGVDMTGFQENALVLHPLPFAPVAEEEIGLTIVSLHAHTVVTVFHPGV